MCTPEGACLSTIQARSGKGLDSESVHRVPEECPEEVDACINACRRLDANERPTALEVCSVIENSAPRRSGSGISMLEGEHR